MVEADRDSYLITEINKSVVPENGWFNFSIYSSYDLIDVYISGPADYSFLNKPGNWSRNIDLSSAHAPPGIYTLRVESEEDSVVNIDHFTVVDVSGWSVADLPMSSEHNGIIYELYPSGEFYANGELIDLTWLKTLAQYENTEVSLRKNSNVFQGSFINEVRQVRLDVNFIKTHLGVKLVFHIESPYPISFDFRLSKAKQILNGFKTQGGIVFDYTDLKQTVSEWVSVDRALGIVSLEIPAGDHWIDPNIYYHGFEDGTDGDASTSTGLGGTATFNTVNPINGSYSMSFGDQDYGGSAYLFYTVPNPPGHSAVLSCAGWFRFDDILDMNAGSDDITLIQFRDGQDFVNRIFAEVGWNGSDRVFNIRSVEPQNVDGSVIVNEGDLYWLNLLSNFTSGEHIFYANDTEICRISGYTGETSRYIYYGMVYSNKANGETFNITSDDFTVSDEKILMPGGAPPANEDFIRSLSCVLSLADSISRTWSLSRGVSGGFSFVVDAGTVYSGVSHFILSVSQSLSSAMNLTRTWSLSRGLSGVFSFVVDVGTIYEGVTHFILSVSQSLSSSWSLSLDAPIHYVIQITQELSSRFVGLHSGMWFNLAVKVVDSGGSIIQEALVAVSRSGSVVESELTPVNGSLVFRLVPELNYTLTISKNSYLTYVMSFISAEDQSWIIGLMDVESGTMITFNAEIWIILILSVLCGAWWWFRDAPLEVGVINSLLWFVLAWLWFLDGSFYRVIAGLWALIGLYGAFQVFIEGMEWMAG